MVKDDLRTSAQNRKLWFLAKQLGISKEGMEEIVYSNTEGRTTHTSELTFVEAKEMISFFEKTLQPTQERKQPNGNKMDTLRKGVIKAIFRYFELRGVNPSIEYVKGVACRASGRMDFNAITEGELRRIYAEFCKKQQVANVMREEDMNFCNN